MKRKPPIVSTRVVIADDHPLILASMGALLAGVPGVQVVGRIRAVSDLIDCLDSTACDVLVTDYSMPGGAIDGLALIRKIIAEYPGLPIVVVTMMSNPAMHVAMLNSGVSALVDKASNARDVISAVQAVRRGDAYVSGTFKSRIASLAKSKAGSRVTTKEAEVLRLIVSGLSVTAIAEQCARSVKTVSRQKVDGMKKLGLNSEIELFEYAREHGLR